MLAINAQRTKFVFTKTVRIRKSGAIEETQILIGLTMTPLSTDYPFGTTQSARTATALTIKTNFVTSLVTISKKKITKMTSSVAKREFRLIQLTSKVGTLPLILFLS